MLNFIQNLNLVCLIDLLELVNLTRMYLSGQIKNSHFFLKNLIKILNLNQNWLQTKMIIFKDQSIVIQHHIFNFLYSIQAEFRLFFIKIIFCQLGLIHTEPRSVLKLITFHSEKPVSALECPNCRVFLEVYASIWLLAAWKMMKKVFGSKVINSPLKIILFCGLNPWLKIDEILRTSLLKVEAKRSRVQDIEGLSQSEGEPMFDATDALGHWGFALNLNLF